MGVGGVLATSVAEPRAGLELQTAVVPVAGVDRPVATGLALCDTGPVVGRRGGGGGRGEQADEDAGDDRHDDEGEAGREPGAHELVHGVLLWSRWGRRVAVHLGQGVDRELQAAEVAVAEVPEGVGHQDLRLVDVLAGRADAVGAEHQVLQDRFV